jgi:glycosyltransferase involved in cell wall biosynthesis
MKVVHLSSSSNGGAGIAALRLHRMLLNANTDSHFISKNLPSENAENCYSLNTIYPFSSRIKTIAKNQLERTGLITTSNYCLSGKYLQKKPEGFEYFSFPNSNLYIEDCDLIKQADIIHLHWIADDFINYKSFFTAIKNKKTVWTLHDMNPFTGGCHHADACRKFTSACRDCPQLPQYSKADTAFNIQQLKKTLYSSFRAADFQIVTPSYWLKELSQRSVCFSRFPHAVIRNPIDSKVYTILDKRDARNKLGLPQDKKIILFVAHNIENARKGIKVLLDAFSGLNRNDVLLCAAGNTKESMEHVKSLGYLESDEQMSVAYNAADVFVLPSYAENFPNTIIESLLCGTPVAAVQTGGIPEQINTDFLVEAGNSAALAKSINDALSSESPDKASIRKSALERFNEKDSVDAYINLYKKMMQ